MRKYVAVFGLVLALALSPLSLTPALDPVNDYDNLAENARATATLLEQLQTEIQQYQRIFKDAMNPGSWSWGNIQGNLNKLMSMFGQIDSIYADGNGINSALEQFHDYDSWSSLGELFGGNPESQTGTALGIQMSITAAALLKIIEE
jgi:P-type conjugative transfer protein TrbJ